MRLTTVLFIVISIVCAVNSAIFYFDRPEDEKGVLHNSMAVANLVAILIGVIAALGSERCLGSDSWVPAFVRVATVILGVQFLTSLIIAGVAYTDDFENSIRPGGIVLLIMNGVGIILSAVAFYLAYKNETFCGESDEDEEEDEEIEMQPSQVFNINLPGSQPTRPKSVSKKPRKKK